jgi:hypothetical protein
MGTIREQFDAQGFIRLKEAIPCHILTGLRQGLDPLREARDSGGDRPTRYQTILEPKTYHRSFAEFLDLDGTNQAAAEIIGTDQLMVAGLACLLGCAEHVVCKWHRDTASMDPAELDLLLNQHPNALVQTNCAVYNDESLWVIPGSHRRRDSPEEAAYAARFDALSFVGPIEAAREIEPEVFAGMPGALNVKLTAGDCLLYNPLLWHAAEYRPEWKRCTLHGGWKDVRLLEQFSLLRWGLGHNPWLLEPDYMGELGENLGPQLKRYQKAVRTYAA